MSTQQTTSSVRQDLSDEELEVQLWRFDEFVALGFDSDQAIALARDRWVELSAGRRLAALGCPPRLAFQILS